MINETKSKIKNYAIKTDVGKDEGNKTIIAVPIGFEEIPELSRNENVDCIVRIDPTSPNSIYRIQYGNNIAKTPSEIEHAVNIFGLNSFWTISRKYNPRVGVFNA